MKLVKHILFGNFWSFLLIVSGLVDVALGVFLFFNSSLVSEGSPIPVYVFCFIVGFFYGAVGVIIAILKMRRQTK